MDYETFADIVGILGFVFGFSALVVVKLNEPKREFPLATLHVHNFEYSGYDEWNRTLSRWEHVETCVNHDAVRGTPLTENERPNRVVRRG